MKKLISFICCIMLLGIFVYAEQNYSGYIVKLKDECVSPFGSLYSDGQEQTFDAEYAAELLAQQMPDVGIVYSPEGLIKAKDEETLQYLIDMGIVEYAEPDLICELYGYEPEDNDYYANQWALEAVNATSAWNVGAFGQEIKVAVIDSGVYEHPDLVDNLLPGANYYGITDVDATPGTDTADNFWHGTFVAGIIAAQCNDIGVVGLAHNVKIVPIKICNDSTFSISYIIPAIYAAVDDFNCDVINLSLGSAKEVTYKNGKIVSGSMPTHQALSSAITYAVNQGCIVVAASGNDGEKQSITVNPDTGDVTEIRQYSIPASFSNVISVGNAMVSSNQDVSKYNIHSSSTHNEYVDVAAPGTKVYSTMNTDSNYSNTKYGTSFSAPYVSAAAAIMKSIDPEIDYRTFNALLQICSDSSVFPKSEDPNYNYHYGAGMLDVESLVDYWINRNYKNGFLSQIDIQNNEYNSSVYVYNPSDETCEYTVIITSHHDTQTISFSLGTCQTKEISITDLGFFGEVEVNLYLGQYEDGDDACFTRSASIPVYKGDINNDKTIDLYDVDILSKYFAGIDVDFDEEMAMRANVYNSDDKSQTSALLNINIKDLIQLVQSI